MANISRQPAEWRIVDWQGFAAMYRERAESAKDSLLRQQFAELARRHLEMAAEIGKNPFAHAAVATAWISKRGDHITD